jgi:hypothetical protein
MRGVWSLATDRIGYRTAVIDVCLFFMGPSSFLQRISFPVCKAQLIGDWYENRRGAQNTISSLYSANTIGAPMHPAPIGVADRAKKK